MNESEKKKCLYFTKLKTHIIGAYGQFDELKPYDHDFECGADDKDKEC